MKLFKINVTAYVITGFEVDIMQYDATNENDILRYRDNETGADCCITCSHTYLDRYLEGYLDSYCPSITVLTFQEDKVDEYVSNMKIRIIKCLRQSINHKTRVLNALKKEGC